MSSVDKPKLNVLAEAARINAPATFDAQIDRDVGEVRKVIFGIPPDTTEGEFMKKAYLRLHAKQGYTEMQERIMLAFRKQFEKIRDLAVTHARERSLSLEQTEEQFRDLRTNLMRLAVVTGQALKTRERPYGKRLEVGAPADQQILEANEAVILERFAVHLESLDFEEIMQTMVEDQDIITMLAETQHQADLGIRDVAGLEAEPTGPGGQRKRENIAADYIVERDAEGKIVKKTHVAKFDINNPNFENNLARLRDFILQRPAPGEKKKSRNRAMLEAVIWPQIVENFTIDQKIALVKSFLLDPDPKAVANARDFIHASILSGAMTRNDAMSIYGNPQDPRFDPFIHEKLSSGAGKDYYKLVDKAVRDHDEAVSNVAFAAKKVDKPIRSFISYYFRFPNLVMSRVFDMAAITVALNTILDIGDGFRKNPGKGFFTKLGAGLSQVVTDKYVGVGLVGMAGSSDQVFPWIRQAALQKSEVEEKASARWAEAKALREQMSGHPWMSQFFERNYDEYLRLLEQRKAEGKEETLYPDDIKISAAEAYDMGYGTESGITSAKAAVLRIFKICTRDLKDEKIDNSEKLATYLQENVFGGKPTKTSKTTA